MLRNTWFWVSVTGLWCDDRDTRTSKTLAMVVAIDKTDDLAKAGFLGEPDFTPSDRQVKP